MYGTCVADRCRSDRECLSGFRCQGLADSDRRICAPACEADQDCPAGQRCIEGSAMKLCASVPDDSCVLRGCPGEASCYIDREVTWGLVARCVTECEPDGTPCPDGGLCVRGAGRIDDENYHCEPDCAVAGYLCPEGGKCVPARAGKSICRFDQPPPPRLR
jgi:hypothetical protein